MHLQTHVLESPFNEVAGLIFFGTTILWNICKGLLLLNAQIDSLTKKDLGVN